MRVDIVHALPTAHQDSSRTCHRGVPTLRPEVTCLNKPEAPLIPNKSLWRSGAAELAYRCKAGSTYPQALCKPMTRAHVISTRVGKGSWAPTTSWTHLPELIRHISTVKHLHEFINGFAVLFVAQRVQKHLEPGEVRERGRGRWLHDIPGEACWQASPWGR